MKLKHIIGEMKPLTVATGIINLLLVGIFFGIRELNKDAFTDADYTTFIFGFVALNILWLVVSLVTQSPIVSFLTVAPIVLWGFSYISEPTLERVYFVVVMTYAVLAVIAGWTIRIRMHRLKMLGMGRV